MHLTWRAALSVLALLGCLAVARADAVQHYPSAAAVWTRQDYSRFYFTHFTTNLALPHLRDAANRRLFERLTDPGNIDRVVRQAASPAAAVRELRIILATLGAIRGSYNLAVRDGEPLQEELVRVQDFTLFTAAAIAELAGGQAPDAASASAMKTTVQGVFTSLSETGTYAPVQTAALADSLARRFPYFAPLFTREERRRLAAGVRALRADAATHRALSRLALTIAAD